MNYTVIVAEDEELLLNNLVQKIQKADPDFQIVGTAQTGMEPAQMEWSHIRKKRLIKQVRKVPPIHM